MLYRDLVIPLPTDDLSGATLPADRLYCLSNFVMTADGKVQALEQTDQYWPIGSPYDYGAFIELRAHVDVVIHGKTTALGYSTLTSLKRPTFTERRAELAKTRPILYLVVSGHPTPELAHPLVDSAYTSTVLVTTERADIPTVLEDTVTVWRFGKEQVDLRQLMAKLRQEGYETAMMEGGPTTFTAFLQDGLLDELFLTIAPKIFGGTQETTLTLTEGPLFPPETVQRLKLISAQPVNNEVFLRYQITEIGGRVPELPTDK